MIIANATRDLPDGTTLKERMAAVDAARPYWFSTASWPKKAWQAARRDYLVRFGYVPRTKKPEVNEAPPLPLFGDSV